MPNLIDADQWSARTAAAFGSRLAALRRETGVSAEELSARLTALGHPIARPVLANLENRRRSVVSIADVYAIAAALGVPAIALLLPPDPGEPVEILPGVEVDPYRAMDWVTGNRILPAMPSDVFENVTERYRWNQVERRWLVAAIEDGDAAAAVRPRDVGPEDLRAAAGVHASAPELEDYIRALIRFVGGWNLSAQQRRRHDDAAPDSAHWETEWASLRERYAQLFADAAVLRDVTGLEIESARNDG